MKKKAKKAPKKTLSSADRLWCSIYEASAHLIGLKPWDKLRPEYLFLYLPEDQDTPAICHLISNPDAIGLMIHPDPTSYFAGQHVSSSPNDAKRAFIESNVFAMHLCHRSELPAAVCSLLQRLHLYSEDEDALVPYFLYKEFGYTTTLPQEEHLFYLFDCLSSLFMMLSHLLEQKLPVDFENGEIMLRFYNQDLQQWLNFAVPKDKVLNPDSFRLAVQESEHLAHLRRCPPAPDGLRIEFDFAWAPEPVEKEGQPSHYPLFLLFTDRVNKTFLGGCHGQADELVNGAFNYLSDLIEQHGRPEALYVCRDTSLCLIYDFASKLGIPVKRVKRLPTIERIRRENGWV